MNRATFLALGVVAAGVILARASASAPLSGHAMGAAAPAAAAPPPAPDFQLKSHLAGRLALTVIEPDGLGFRVRAELRPAHLEQQPAPEQSVDGELGRAFYFTLTPRGEAQSFFFARETSYDARVQLKELVAALQLVTPPVPAPAWQLVERDVSGEFEASYTLAAGAVAKTKTRYLRRNGLGGMLPVASDSKLVVQSQTQFALDRTGWPQTATATDRFDDDRLQTHIQATNETTARLVAVEARPELAGAMPERDVEAEAALDRLTAEQAKHRADLKLLGQKTWKDLLVDLHGSTHDRALAQAQLAALFRLDPSSILDARAALLGGGLDENAKHRMAGALGSAGTPEAQAGLVSLLQGKDEARREDAAVSLGLTRAPTPENVEAMKAAAKGPDAHIADTALLGLGSLVRTMEAAQTAAGAADPTAGDPSTLFDQILAALQAATDDASRTVCLQALGNTGDPRALAALQPYLGSADVVLRGVAVASLRFIAGADAAIAAALRDPALDVRLAAVDTLPYRAVAPLLGALTELLRGEPQETVRLAVVRALNLKQRESPAVLDLLRWAEENDPSGNVRLLAHRALSPAPAQ